MHRERPDLSRTRALLRTAHDLRLVGRRSDFYFETDLYDLFGRHTKIGGRQIGVEVHRREKPLPPNGHSRHLAVSDNHDPS